MTEVCLPPPGTRGETLHWVRCARTGEFLIWRWRECRWVTGPMSVFAKSPEWAAAQGYRYVSAWLPSFIPTEEEAASLSKSMAYLRRQTAAGRDETSVRRRKKRHDRLAAKQFRRVVSLGKDDAVAAAARQGMISAAEAARAKGVTYLPLKMLRNGKLDKAQYDAAVRYRDELDIANGISDGPTFAAAGGQPSDPGGAIDRRVHAGQIIAQADNLLGRDQRAVVIAFNTESSMNSVAASLRCSRDTAEERLKIALDALDRLWSRRAPPARREG